LCATLAAQTSLLDSLEQVLASGKLKNKEKTELLVRLSQEYMIEDTVKCRTNATEALKMAQKHGFKMEEARAHATLGALYYRKIVPYQAHVHYLNAEKIFLELNDRDGLYEIYNSMMNMFWRIDDYDNAAYYANKAQKMTAAKQKDWWRMMLFIQMIHGEASFPEYNSQEALDYFLNLHQRALHLEDSLGLNHVISSLVGERCSHIYAYMNRPHEALPYFYQALAFALNRGNKYSTGIAYINLAEMYSMMNNIDSTEYYINKSVDYPIASTYYVFILHHARAKIDSLKGNYLSALANFQKYHHIKDSLSKDEKTTEMARLKLWHEFDQKEIEKRILKQEYQKQRKQTITLAIALVIIFVLLALAIFFYRKIRENNRELNEMNRIITEKNSELEELHTVKDKLFSVVAHDLRNPMSALMSVLKLTHMNVLDAETQARMLKDVSKQVNNVYGLLDNLLRWAKSQMQGMVVSPVYFDVQKEIRTVESGLQEIAAAKMVALNNLAGNQEVYSDRDMFSVVVRNLATNALKYTSAGGEVTINSELLDSMLVVSVKDTGTGMPQEVQDKLFNLSETQSRRGTNNESGTGLGLVLCADFVKANGGNIWFSSVQDEGSTFFFSVPVKS